VIVYYVYGPNSPRRKHAFPPRTRRRPLAMFPGQPGGDGEFTHTRTHTRSCRGDRLTHDPLDGTSAIFYPPAVSWGSGNHGEACFESGLHRKTYTHTLTSHVAANIYYLFTNYYFYARIRILLYCTRTLFSLHFCQPEYCYFTCHYFLPHLLGTISLIVQSCFTIHVSKNTAGVTGE